MKIVKNPGKVGEFKDAKYLFEANVDGDILYARIGIKPIIGLILYKIGKARKD